MKGRRRRYRRPLYSSWLLGLTAGLLLSSGPAAEASAAEPAGSGRLCGLVRSAVSGEGLGFATLVLPSLRQSISTNSQGEFCFSALPEGRHKLRVMRIGYRERDFSAVVVADDSSHIVLDVIPIDVRTDEVLVESKRSDSTRQPALEMAGERLRQSLGTTIAHTIANEPGLAQRTMGPAPARPVLRGLSGDRLLILEDGGRTGDLSHTSSDHALVVEPITAERIEVIRGPRALLYGSNSMAGVVNVVRGIVPSVATERIQGSLSMQGESVNSGYALAGAALAPLDPLSIHVGGSLRRAADIATPGGDLRNTSITGATLAIGAGVVEDWGRAGLGGSYYDSRYGIPPDPAGGHPSGVRIEIDRRHFESQVEFLPDASWIQQLRLSQSSTRYFHEEIETGNEVGARFLVHTHKIRALMTLAEPTALAGGSLGFWMELRDYAAGGLSFTPNVKEYSAAFFAHRDLRLDALLLSAALRLDHKTVAPDEERFSRRVGAIRRRGFTGLSASLAARYQLGEEWSLGLTLMRTHRAPVVEELFSEGPHLAAYSYEVGNAELGQEQGHGIELNTAFETENCALQLAVFQNWIDNFIFPQNTGMRSLRRADLYLYRYAGLPVRLYGAEVSARLDPAAQWRVEGSASFVRGLLAGSDDDLPRIPPLQARLATHYSAGNTDIGIVLRGASAQNHPGEFELPTRAYLVLDLTAQYHFSAFDVLHTLSFTLENAANQEYRRHLNRVKEILPEPGRNARLLYKVYF